MDPGSVDQRHVFISFGSADAALARHVVESLERGGLRCWYSDRDIAPAASYPAAITDAVKSSGALLLLLTQTSNQSPHVVREVELAFAARKPVLPVRIAGAAPSADLQYFLSRSQWLDVGPSLDETEIAAVQSRLRELLRRGTIGGLVLDGSRSWLRLAAVAAAIVAVAVALFFWSSRGGGPEPTPPTEPGGAPAAGPGVPPAPAAETVKTNTKDGQRYVWIPPGTFTMGCSPDDPDCEDDEKPPHVVEIPRGFWLAQFEVLEQPYQARASGGRAQGSGADTRLPVVDVSRAAAKSYCESVGGRLPTEAEWEYAARAGTTTRYYGRLPAIAWFADNSDGERHVVGGKMPNAFGLFDMLGNVSEWVLDRYYNAYDETSDPLEPDEPLAPNATAVARGGSWVSEAGGVRASRRLEMEADAEEVHIGFRCALDAVN